MKTNQKLSKNILESGPMTQVHHILSLLQILQWPLPQSPDDPTHFLTWPPLLSPTGFLLSSSPSKLSFPLASLPSSTISVATVAFWSEYSHPTP